MNSMNNSIMSSMGMGSRGTKPAGGASRGNSAGGFSGGSRGGGKGDIIPKGHRAGVLQEFTPEQIEMFQNMFGQIGPDSDIFKMASGDESYFDEMEAPAWRKFQEAQGQLGSRFSQLAPGAMSAQRGGGFKNQAGQLGSDFAMNLASNRQNLSRQALKDLMEMSHMLMNEKPYERIISGKKEKESTNWGGLAGAGVGAVGGFFAGGPAGAFTGAYAGYNIGSNF